MVLFIAPLLYGLAPRRRASSDLSLPGGAANGREGRTP
jgi:hypothetical protein